MRLVTTVIAAIMLLCAWGEACAQDAVPAEILSRTVFIRLKGSNEGGSAFTLDYKGKIYLVTAKHVVDGVPSNDAVIEILRSGKWENYHTVRTIYPSSADADIAVFETNETAQHPFQIAPTGASAGVVFGQVVWFVGYPFGMSSILAKGSPVASLPFMKRGSMSAVDASNPDAVVYYIDGFNDPGFSGGPVIYWEFGTHKYKILSVVKGYKSDTAKVIINGKPVDTHILVNSGILVSYSIDHAIDAIEKSLASKP